jgi:hypothetical protein
MLGNAGAYGGPVDDDLAAELDPVPAEAPADGEGDESFERPVDRFRKGAVGSVVAAGLLGLADALEARPPREEVVIVQEAPTGPPLEPRRLELLLDPEHPERSMVFLPAPTDARELPDEAT